jgi:hypothetical protein
MAGTSDICTLGKMGADVCLQQNYLYVLRSEKSLRQIVILQFACCFCDVPAKNLHPGPSRPAEQRTHQPPATRTIHLSEVFEYINGTLRN